MRSKTAVRRVSLLAGSLAVVAGVSVGLPAAAQSLEEALIQAYQSNPTLSAARAQLRATNERVPQALSGWRPTVEAQGSGGKAIDDDVRPVAGDEGRSPASADLTVTQPLYRGGRTVAGTERAENEVLAERSRLASTEQDVLVAAVTAYADVWRDQSVLELNINNEQVLARQLEATQDRFDVGELTRTDVAQSESRLSSATADRIGAQGNLTTSRATFENVIGTYPTERLEQPPLPPVLPEDQQAILDLAEAANPSVLATSFDELAALRSVREVEGELLPTVELQGSVGYQHERTARTSEGSTAEVLAVVRVPLYQQGAVSSRVREAKQVASQRRLQVREAIRRAREDAISAWERLLTARAQISALQESVRANEIALEGVRQENAVGARTVLDVLDAEQELLDAQVSLVSSQRDEIVASYEVLSAIGRMTAADLGLDTAIYDPVSDYRKVRERWFGLDAPGTEIQSFD